MKDYKHCKLCKHYSKCYVIALGTDSYPGSLDNWYNAIRERDLCVNNGKDNFVRGESSG